MSQIGIKALIRLKKNYVLKSQIKKGFHIPKIFIILFTKANKP